MTLSDQLPSLRSSIPPRLEPGIWPITAHATGRRDLLLGGVSLSEVVGMFGTPTYVFDEEDVRNRCRDYRRAFYDGEGVCGEGISQPGDGTLGGR